ncbi:hypothetical protein MKW94_000906 [Papaver nudicaule]|uniref:Auxin-responsive protein n=1 Tax=Papaver nudicaule TaxID=74823 RepID=A0AA41RQN4_PAPNU|nr:hypothetical protein [Papaver nudicaule]
MECGDSRTGGESSPQLLDLIPGWGGGGNERRNFGGSEERKLELKLGPPGEEDWFSNGNNNNNNNKDIVAKSSSLYLGGSGYSSKTLNNNSSTKRGFQDTIHHETTDNKTVLSSNPSTSYAPANATITNNTIHQKRPVVGWPPVKSFLRFPQNQSTVLKNSSQNNDKNKVLSTPATSSGPANATITNTTSQKRTAAAPVVGWPPVRSFRKNLTNKPAATSTGSPNEVPSKEIKVKQAEMVVKKGMMVKINMDGVPIGRKVDLNALDSYEKLSSAVDQLFRDLLAAQKDSSADLNCPHVNEAKAITGLLDGSGEYTLVYEDNEGDRMLVGDVPWGMFAATVKRLRVLKTTELSTLHIGNNSKQGKPVET